MKQPQIGILCCVARRTTTELKQTIEDYIRELRWVGLTEDETREKVTAIVKRQNAENILGVQLDIVEEVYAEHWHRRYRRQEVGSHTKQEWDECKERYNNRCFYCGRPDRVLTKDHIIPIAKGGVNTIGNIVPACMDCNRRKGMKALAQFKEGLVIKLI